jgi:putative restriction endonuclease
VSYLNPYLEAIRNLNVYHRGDRRAPHKPLLLLVAISNVISGDDALVFSKVEASLSPLLATYAPPVRSRHQPELPYWHLRSSGLWEVSGADELSLQEGGFPRMASLRETSGHLEAGFKQMLLSNPTFLSTVVTVLLEDHFPESLHLDILASIGIRLPQESATAENAGEGATRRPRDRGFRHRILRAYEHRCAVSGFQVALAGQFFGCEAAHVQWHAYDGPDQVDIGFAVEPTLHKLFDAGAWTLTDDRKILVSKELTGTSETIERVRSLHGKPLRKPLPGEPELSVEYIHWHREQDLGGVFRQPALSL